jgi:hypothetical protein
MYFSLGQAAKEVGVAKSTISKALSSGKLSYSEKNSAGYKIDPAELFRVFPKTSATSSSELPSYDRKSGATPIEAAVYTATLEIQLTGLKHLIAEKERRIADLESDRSQLRDDQRRQAQTWRDERDQLMKMLEDQTVTVKLLTDERANRAEEAPRSFWQKVFGPNRKSTAIAA